MSEPDFRPPRQQTHRSQGGARWVWGAVVIAVLGVGAWYAKPYWDARQQAALPVPMPAPAPTPAVVTPEPEPEPALSDAKVSETVERKDPLPLHPLADIAEQAVGDASTLDSLAMEWLGKSALQFLVMPGLAQHVVVTIDNLPRSHAAPRLWPLSPVGGKILLEQGESGLHIAPGNSARYDEVVNFVTGIDPAQAAAWYRQAYPLLQHTYEELGYPGKYFNDRLVEVIDHLLQTPEPQGPLAVELIQVQGSIAPQQPWLRYEYADEDLEKRSAGQKILLRLGEEHRHRIKAYLQSLRAQIVKDKAPL